VLLTGHLEFLDNTEEIEARKGIEVLRQKYLFIGGRYFRVSGGMHGRLAW